MSVRFIIGRAGSGKSLYCFDRIVEMMRADPMGPPIFWILPKQETFTAERDLTCGSGLSGFCRTRVVSFEILGEDVLAECGGTAMPQVTPLGRQMVVGHLLRKHHSELKYYGSTTPRQGLAAEMDATFAELERTGHSADHIAALVTSLKHESPDDSLALKLADIQLVYGKYFAYLGQDKLDPHRRLERVLQSIAQCKRIRGATIFVDGFFNLYDWQRKMLVALAHACHEVHVTLLIDPGSPVLRDPHLLPDDLSLFHQTEQNYRRLWFAFSESGIEPQEPVVLRTISRFTSPSLKQIEQHTFADPPATCGTAQNIRLIEAPDRRAEVDAAARQVREYLAGGMRLRDIAVLARNLEDYQDLIDSSFIEHDIPWFADRRRTAAHHPLLQFTRALLEIALHNWRHDAVMTLIKSGLAGIKSGDGDELENYVLLHRIRGAAWINPQPWNFDCRTIITPEDDQIVEQTPDSARMDALRRHIADKIQPLSTLLKGSRLHLLKPIVIELLNTLEQFGVRATLRQWMTDAEKTDQLETRAEHAQVWTEFAEMLDQLVDVLGDQEVTPEDFVGILDTGLEQFSLAMIPPTVDQVLVGAIDRTRSIRPRAAIILGMNDAQFPRASPQGQVLSDPERQTLKKHQLELEPDTRRGLLDEHLLGYVALTRASEHLCLTRAIADDDARPQTPSPFWNTIRNQFPSLVPEQIPRDNHQRMDLIATPRQLVSGLMNWVRRDKLDDRAWRSLYQCLATHACTNDSIDIMRSRAWRALCYTNEAKLSTGIVKQLFDSTLHASVSRIETFAACPFRHFARYGLNLNEREEPDVTHLDLGNVFHGILEQMVGLMLKQKATWDMPDETQIKAISQKVAQGLRGELMLGSARNQYILRHVERTVAQIVNSQKAAAKRGKFVPFRAELKFGRGGDLAALELQTPNGKTLTLHGRIDRVDKVVSQAAVAVIDYKLNDNSLSLDWVYHGLSLQLLAYLLVLHRVGKYTPAAAFYVKLLRQLEAVSHPDDATPPDDPAFDLQVKPRGIIDVAFRNLLDNQLAASGSSNVVNLRMKKDGTLGFRKTSDGVETTELAAMLGVVERKLVELADQIMAGDIDVKPYTIAGATPCSHCEYRSVCRFDSAINRYKHLAPIGREEVLKRALEHKQ